MISFIKQVKHRISKDAQHALFFVIILFSAVISLVNVISVVDFLEIFVVIACTLAAVIFLYLKKRFIASHVVLFLMLYTNGLGTLIRSLFSYNFAVGAFTTQPQWEMFISGIISIYLILMILSYVIDEKITFKFEVSEVLIMIIIGAIYAYVRYGFSSMLLSLIPAVIALFSGVPLAAMLIVICQLIGIPFEILDTLITSGLGGYSIFYYLIRIIGLGLLGYFGYKSYKLFFTKR